LRRLRAAGREPDAGPVRHDLYRFRKSDPFDLLDERKNIPANPASEALKQLPGLADVERGSFLAVKGTEGNPIVPLTAQLHVTSHDVHDVCGGTDALEKSLIELHGVQFLRWVTA